VERHRGTIGRLAAYPFELLAVPVLLWAAIRLNRIFVVIALAGLSVAVIAATASGAGPFVRATPAQSWVAAAAYLAAMAAAALTVSYLAARRAASEAKLLEHSLTDQLTGLGNHRRLLEALRAEIARSDRTRRPVSILMIDIAGLKQINDRDGFAKGSRALVRVAEAIRESCRVTDLPARVGGDEFAIVLTEAQPAGAEALLARIAQRLHGSDEKPPVAITGGVAAYPADGGTPGKLLGVAADRRSRAGLRETR